MYRREFLKASPLAAAAFVTQPVTTVGQSESPAASLPAGARDYWNDLPNRMVSNIGAARARRKSDIAKVTSSTAAEDRISFIRTKVWESVGGKPDETPLNARTTGVIDREKYCIEKVVFESQPKFYATAHLYLPKSGVRPYPAILAPLGHYPEGKANRSYQTVFQNLARKGFVVLAFDPPGQGERLQYLDAGKTRSLYGPTGEHDRFGWPALLIGSSTTQFEVWDGIRGLDYLISRPEIDRERIGCCGHSGGGTQTMFLCALEPRIKAAVVVEGHTENVAGADYEPPGAYADAEQNLIGGLKIPLDRGDLLAAFAPKPLRICYSPIDNGSTYSPHYVQGTLEICEELESFYAVYGARDRIALFSSTLPHDYDYFQRRATYEWFSKWLLNGQGDVEEVAFEDAPKQTLWCTTTGQVLTSLGGRHAFQVNHDRIHAMRAQANGSRPDRERIQADLRELLNLPVGPKSVRAFSLSSQNFNNITIEEIEYESEPGIRVPGWFLKPSAGSSKLPVVLITADEGRNGLFDRWPLIERATHAGIAICSIDLRTNGATRPRLPSTGPLFYGSEMNLAYSLVNLSLGSPILGQQTRDLISGVDFLIARNDVDPARVAVSGTGISGLACMAGAALDQRVSSLLLSHTLSDFESVVASEDYDLPLSAVVFGILRKLDLPELCASLAPRPVWLLNTVGPSGNVLTLSDIRESYQGAIRAYDHDKQGEKLCLCVEPDPADDVTLAWMQKVLKRSDPAEVRQTQPLTFSS
jgi:cephalosporin-C deacetylase-like acetyl esterase